MKKIYIAALVVLTTAALNSCMQEKSFKDVKIGEKDIVFSLQGAAATRAAEATIVERGVKLELEANEDGQKLFLEEELQTLLIADTAGFCFVFQSCEYRCCQVCHYSHTPIRSRTGFATRRGLA